MKDKIFGEGIYFNRPREGAPEFIKGQISLKVADLGIFMAKHEKNGYVNLDLKESKKGVLYLELNTWEKKPESTLTAEEMQKIKKAREKSELNNLNYPTEEINPLDVPF